MILLVVFGTRPEAIKMCPLIKKLKKESKIKTIVCVSGQHKEMLYPILSMFGVVPDYDLKIMKKNQTLGMITTKIISGVEQVIKKEHPDIVLVHGDTTTSYAASLAAYYNHVKIGHVEAGLRTYNMQSPYPEEFNRQSIDLISDFMFTPTEFTKKNLVKEGKSKEKIFVTGNTVIDAFETTISNDYKNENFEWARGSKLILLTAHRRENIGEPMERIFLAVRRIVNDNEDVKVLYPVHKNPKVREIAHKYLGEHEQIRLVEPLDVIDFHNIMKACFLILTDSGGIQEEAPTFRVPVLVMRDATERIEGLEAGTMKLVGTSEEMIYDVTNSLLKDCSKYKKMQMSDNPYGDGHASERIINVLKRINGY